MTEKYRYTPDPAAIVFLKGPVTQRQVCAENARGCWLLAKSLGDPAASRAARRLAQVWIVIGRRYPRMTPGRWIANALDALERQEGKDRR